MPPTGPVQSYDIPVSVATVAELSGIPISFPSGATVWVEQLGQQCILRIGQGLAVGPGVYASTAGPNAVWQILGSPGLMTQTAWFVDPINGNDANVGTSAAQALKTDAERQKRWGRGTVLLNNPTTVTYLSSPPATDKVNFNCDIADGASLVVQGTRTPTKTGALQAVTALNRGTQTPWSVTDAVGALGAADVGKIIRITGGARAGNYARVMKDNGGNNVRTTPFGVLAFNFIPFTQAIPQVNDPYEVDSLTTLSIGIARFSQLSNSAPTAGPPPTNCVQFDSVTLDGTANFLGAIESYNINIFYSQCVLLRIGLAGVSGIHNIGGGGADGVFCTSETINTFVSTGFFHSLAGLSVNQGAECILDGDALFQNCEALVDGTVLGGQVSFFDGANDGRVLVVNEDGTYKSIGFASTDLLWGTNNTNHGARVKSGGKLVYTTKPTVNGGLGAGREVLVGGNDKQWIAGIPFFDSGAAASGALVTLIA